MLHITKGWVAPETVGAVERIAVLAKKTGNLAHLGEALASRGFNAWMSGDLLNAGDLADQALELALRENNPRVLAHRYMLQVIVRYWRGDLVAAEQYFTTGLKFFLDPTFRKAGTIAALAYGAFVAWTLGRAKTAHQRLNLEMASVTVTILTP